MSDNVEIRNRVYWGLWIQYLAHLNLLDAFLDEFLDVVSDTYSQCHTPHAIPAALGVDHRVMGMFERREIGVYDMFSYLTDGEKHTVNLWGLVRASSRYRDVAERLTGQVRWRSIMNVPEDHPFYGRRWSNVATNFVDNCIRGRRPQRTKIARIKQLIIDSGGRV